ncbi:MAG: hypothetical protein RI947_1184 [Candidatus Parcubacteria bacterium]|jgi:hypothetical protein
MDPNIPDTQDLQPRSSHTIILAVVGLMFLFTVAVGSYYAGVANGKKQILGTGPTPTVTLFSTPTPGDVGCTLEAQLCPDGSSVGRRPPSCAFDPCPTQSAGLYPVHPENTSPALQKGSNLSRRANLTALMSALQLYIMDNGQTELPISPFPRKISKKDVDICPLLVPSYIGALPRDPRQTYDREHPIYSGGSISACGEDYDTGYTIQVTDTSITLAAPLAEGGEIISITQ